MAQSVELMSATDTYLLFLFAMQCHYICAYTYKTIRPIKLKLDVKMYTNRLLKRKPPNQETQTKQPKTVCVQSSNGSYFVTHKLTCSKCRLDECQRIKKGISEKQNRFLFAHRSQIHLVCFTHSFVVHCKIFTSHPYLPFVRIRFGIFGRQVQSLKTNRNLNSSIWISF